MPKSYYKPSDLDEPIMHGKRLGFSVEEIAAALGIDFFVVANRIEANMAPKPLPLAMPRNKWSNPRRHLAAKGADDGDRSGDRYSAWLRAKKGAQATLGMGTTKVDVGEGTP